MAAGKRADPDPRFQNKDSEGHAGQCLTLSVTGKGAF